MEITNVNVQPSWTTRVINSSQLKSKQPYQRKIDMKFIGKCVKGFNSNKIDPDGQHTILILEAINGNKPVDIQCIVHKGMIYTDEADYYVDQYEKKHHHTFNEMAVASYEAGRELPCELATKVAQE